MAKIGRQLLQPENGWTRYNDNNNMFTYSGNFSYAAGQQNYYQGDRTLLNQNGKVNFTFTGTQLRLIGVSGSSLDSTNVSVVIDGQKATINPVAQSPSLVYQSLVFESSTLSNTVHNVEIVNNEAKFFAFDAIDVTTGLKYMAIRDELQDKHYSLLDKALIHLPDSAPDTLKRHGTGQGRAIQLDTPFTSHLYPTTVTNKIATVNIDKANSLTIKEPLQSWTPLYTWYETKMTSNTAPAPLVASASSVYNNDPRYLEYKAFNGTTSDANDAFIFASGVLTGWIQLDFGKNTQVESIRINSVNNSNAPTATPKDMKLQGSLDGTLFDDIYTLPTQTGWGINEVRSFDTGKKSNYRFYRLVVNSNNGYASYTAIGQISFGYKREVN